MSASRPSRQQVRGRRHLLDMEAPRQIVGDPVGEARSLDRVQRWVSSTLAVTMLLHLSGAAVLAAMTLDDPARSAEISLNVIAGFFGILTVAAALAIHRRPIVSPWLLVGVLPAVVGLWLTLR